MKKTVIIQRKISIPAKTKVFFCNQEDLIGIFMVFKAYNKLKTQLCFFYYIKLYQHSIYFYRMGTCSLNQTVSNHQVTQEDDITDDFHKVSSTMQVKNNHELFELSETRLDNFETLKFSHPSTRSEKTHDSIFRTFQNQEKPAFYRDESTIINSNFEQATLPFSEKENIFMKTKSVKVKGRNSSVRISGDFLKIKEKQACSEYKVLAKITNKKIGQLYKVMDKTTSQVRSLEIIKEDQASVKTLHQVNLLKRLDHPNIYHLYDVFLKKGFYYIIGEYIQGDNLFCLTRDHEVITEKKLSKVIKQIFQALNYLHYRGIMHRNIKPETIVFEARVSRAQTQFPAIKLMNFKKAAEIQLTKEQIGNYFFMAPQMLIGSHNQKCDVWSVGVILYMLATGELPFAGETKEEVQKNILGKDIVFKGANWDNKSQSLKDLLKLLLQKSPTKRISAQQALNSSWFRQASDRNTILLSKNTMKNLLCTRGDSKFQTIIKTYLVKMTTSLQQRQQMAKKFQSIDLDQSGFIDKKELLAAYQEIHGQEISKDVDLDGIIERIDVNSSGMIDFSEFMAAISKVEKLFAKERLEKAFQFIDRDGTGEIEISELMELLNTELENDGENDEEDEEIAEIMKEFDHDGDKTISKKEFIDFFLKIKEAGKIKSVSNLKVDRSK